LSGAPCAPLWSAGDPPDRQQPQRQATKEAPLVRTMRTMDRKNLSDARSWGWCRDFPSSLQRFVWAGSTIVSTEVQFNWMVTAIRQRISSRGSHSPLLGLVPSLYVHAPYEATTRLEAIPPSDHHRSRLPVRTRRRGPEGSFSCKRETTEWFIRCRELVRYSAKDLSTHGEPAHSV